jgi:hypothetical protein
MPSAQRQAVKTDIAVIDSRCGAPIKTCKAADLLDFDVDLAKVTSMVGDENPVFSGLDTPDMCDEDDAASELGDYELSYLHSLYNEQGDLLSSHSHDTTDAILPDAPPSLSAMAPPSLGVSHLATGFAPSAPSSTSSAFSRITAGRLAQPDTPPRGNTEAWNSDVEDEESDPASRTHSPIPDGPAALAKSVSPSKLVRKRKAPAHLEESSPSPIPKKRAAAPPDGKARKDTKEHAHKYDKYDSDDSEDERGGSPHPTLDGLEIRPEDDPLGLFQKDPATLTAEEQRILKKQRRLLKNRESAQLSRHRKKMHLHTLERQVDALKKAKAALAQRIAELADENERIRKLCV